MPDAEPELSLLVKLRVRPTSDNTVRAVLIESAGAHRRVELFLRRYRFSRPSPPATLSDWQGRRIPMQPRRDMRLHLCGYLIIHREAACHICAGQRPVERAGRDQEYNS